MGLQWQYLRLQVSPLCGAIAGMMMDEAEERAWYARSSASIARPARTARRAGAAGGIVLTGTAEPAPVLPLPAV